jgi:hypothetical protein
MSPQAPTEIMPYTILHKIYNNSRTFPVSEGPNGGVQRLCSQNNEFQSLLLLSEQFVLQWNVLFADK